VFGRLRHRIALTMKKSRRAGGKQNSEEMFHCVGQFCVAP